MKNPLASIINKLASPFIGRGYIHKYFPFLVTAYEKSYSLLQKEVEVEVVLKDGKRMFVYQNDSHVGMYLLTKGEFEPVETKSLLTYLNNSLPTFDIGANVGYYTLVASNDSKAVYAFEPDKRNYQLLEKNIRKNNLKNVSAHPVALGGKDGNLNFKESKGHLGKSTVVEGKGAFDYSVEVKTLDTFCAENHISEIGLIKLDVEGSELNILKGGREIISNSPNIKLFIEYNPASLKEFGNNHDDFIYALSEVGLRPTKIIDEFNGEVIDYSEQALNSILKRATYTNLLCEK